MWMPALERWKGKKMEWTNIIRDSENQKYVVSPSENGRWFSGSTFSSHFTVIALAASHIYFAGKETAVEFAGLAGGCGGDEKGVQLVAHKTAGRYVFGRYVYDCKKGAVFCASLFNAAAAPKGYPEIIFCIDAHSVCHTTAFFRLK